jgi:hypothetical protein
MTNYSLNKKKLTEISGAFGIQTTSSVVLPIVNILIQNPISDTA